ncbi:PucR family transcriptional regulator [Alkalithermobacter paradoxus]|uniref:Carbohydrate diacid regulator n=1 Tax=Alkalithermobacter paradoxus TaxID=29349 RepID=A0A1V4I4X4_9FIRM|nr:carbohydrate diacid regulator [[Clostridium] thermoalcaliphilum]
MKNLINFLEEKLDKKIEIYEYDENLKDKYEEVEFRGKKYLIEIKEKEYIKINGHTYILRCKDNQNEALEVLKNLFCDEKVYIKEDYVIIQLHNNIGFEESIIDILASEIYSSVKIVYLGYIKDNEEFNFRFNIGKNILKYTEQINERKNIFKLRDIVKYDLLNLIDKNKIKEYKEYILNGKDINILDKDIINTSLEFINSDLNIAQTAKKLYIHRNTLIYRLDKIKEIFDLDLRKFEDAFYFYISILFFQKNKKID